MEPEQIFSKRLRRTDLKNSLVIPVASLERFPEIPEGHCSIEFTALDLEGLPWPLCLSTRKLGRYPKPVLNARGWLAFAKAKCLKEGDRVTLSKETNEANGVIFRIQTP